MKECDSKKTLLENRIADLSQHFESACIAGPWSLDAAYDGVLSKEIQIYDSIVNHPNECPVNGSIFRIKVQESMRFVRKSRGMLRR